MSVYVSKPSNVTGVTLSNPSCVDGTYALAYSATGSGSIWGNTSQGGYASQYFTSDSGWVTLLRESVTGFAPSPYIYTHGDTDALFHHAGAFRINTQNHITGVVYKDYGTDYFSGDFTVMFDGFCAKNLRYASAKGCIAWSLSNKLGPWHSYTNGGYDVGNAVTVSISSPCTVTKIDPGTDENTEHQLTVGMPVVFHTTGALPTGITAGQTYYVIAAGLTLTEFRFSASPGGPAVNTSGSQSGNHSFTNFPDTQESDLFGLVVRQKATFDPHCYLDLYVGGTLVDFIEIEDGALGTVVAWGESGTQYWITITRTEGSPSTIRVDIYTDAARTTHSSFVSNLGTTGYMIYNLPSDEDYRYMYLHASYEDFGWYMNLFHGFTGFYVNEKKISWGGGTQSLVSSDGVYPLDDGSGNTINATITVDSLPATSQTDNIIICNDPIHTDAATNIAGKTMTANGEIFVSGATTRGFCYKAGVVTPTIADSKVYSTGSFVAEAYDKGMTGLSRETTYSIRAYMYIDGDLYYGTVVTAKTLFGIISMAITPVNQFIDLGETQQYTVTATMDDASTQDITDRCTYTSSDTDVATISNTPGTIGLATGTSTPTTTNSWSYGTGWSVVGSTAVHTGATSGLMLNGMRTTIEATFVCDDGTFTDDTYLFVSFLISGGNYTIQFYVTGMGSGASVVPYIGSTAGVAVAENGCHVQNIVAPASARYINFAAVGTLTVEKVLIFIEKNLTVSTDQTELPSQYQHLMVLYATACGLNKDKKYQAANMTAAMYNSELIYAKTNLEDIVPDSKSDVRRK